MPRSKDLILYPRALDLVNPCQAKIVIKNDDRMDNSEYIGLAEKISRELEKVDGVKTVRSMSRPAGEAIDDFLIPTQVKSTLRWA
jgi:uncharacterized membrane protein YdfJ with MMPL/SSD domain